MSDLIHLAFDDVVYILSLSPFNYIVSLFLLSSVLYIIFTLIKGGE